MIRPQKNNALKLSALALAAAAIVAPAAWSGGRVPLVDRSQVNTTSGSAQQEQHDRFIITYRDSSRAAKLATLGKLPDASSRLSMGINPMRHPVDRRRRDSHRPQARRSRKQAADGRIDERPERAGGRSRHSAQAAVRA